MITINPKKNLRMEIFLYLLLGSLIPALIILLISVKQFRKNLHAELISKTEGLREIARADLGSLVDSIKSSIARLSQREYLLEFIEAGEKAHESLALFAAHIKQTTVSEKVAIYNNNGSILVSTDKKEILKLDGDLLDKIERKKEEKIPVHVSFRIDQERGFRLDAYAPVVEPFYRYLEGILRGTVFIDKKFIEGIKQKTGLEVCLFHQEKAFIYTSSISPILDSSIFGELIKTRDFTAQDTLFLGSVPYYTLLVPILNEDGMVLGAIGLLASEEAINRNLRLIQAIFIMTLLGIIAFSFGVSYVSTRRIINPISNVVKAIRGIAQGDLRQRLEVETKNEISELSRSFNLMAEDLQSKTKLVLLLQEIAVTSNEASTMEEALQICLDKVCAHTGWPIGHAYLPDSNRKLIPSKIWHIENPEQFEVFRKITEVTSFDMGVGLPGRVIATGKPAWIIDVNLEPNFLRAKLAKDIGVKAGFAFPVLEGSKVVAVLEFFSEEVKEVDKNLLETISSLATQIGRVTERKRAEEEKRRMQMKMLASSKLATLGEISTGVAHEINQPLTYISSLIQSLTRDLKERSIDEEKLEEKLKFASSQVNRIISIINHLRTFGRQYDMQMEKVDFGRILENTLLLLGERIRLRNIKLVRNTGENLPMVWGNQNQLEQVFINLFQNSIDAFKDKKENAEIRVDISRLDNREEVQIKFSDNGPGMEGPIREKIFEPFFTTKEVGKGTGLGLSIIYGIIQEHKGDITCESVINKGTTFTIKIPLEKRNIRD